MLLTHIRTYTHTFKIIVFLNIFRVHFLFEVFTQLFVFYFLEANKNSNLKPVSGFLVTKLITNFTLEEREGARRQRCRVKKLN